MYAPIRPVQPMPVTRTVLFLSRPRPSMTLASCCMIRPIPQPGHQIVGKRSVLSVSLTAISDEPLELLSQPTRAGEPALDPDEPALEPGPPAAASSLGSRPIRSRPS